jgi:hypothetical protein
MSLTQLFSKQIDNRQLVDELRYTCEVARRRGNSQRTIIEALVEVACARLARLDPYCESREWVVEKFKGEKAAQLLDVWAEQVCTGEVFDEEGGF